MHVKPVISMCLECFSSPAPLSQLRGHGSFKSFRTSMHVYLLNTSDSANFLKLSRSRSGQWLDGRLPGSPLDTALIYVMEKERTHIPTQYNIA